MSWPLPFRQGEAGMRYELTARQVPALVTLLPVALAFAAAGGDHWKSVQSLLAIACGVGAQVILAKFARYVGQRQEDRLWTKWGGNPAALFLRHCDDRLSPVTKERYRAFLEKSLGRPLPMIEEEKVDPESAMKVYVSCIDHLRSATRSDAFSLILAENINYGLARNLFGLKPFGVVLCLLSLGLLGWLAAPFSACGAGSNAVLAGTGAVSVVVMLAGWIFWVREDWVKRCADAYARMLLEATERLPEKK